MRRRHLFAIAGTGLAGLTGLAGCLGSLRTDGGTDGDPTTTATIEPAAPRDRVGSGAYLTVLERRVDSDRFPDPDPDLIPRLTEARFVVDAATEAGDDEFAASVSERRDPVFDPLEQFDQTIARARETEVDDPDAFVEENLSRRERTFLDYPAPPHHFIEGAGNRGRELIDAAARRDELRDAVGDDSSTYVDQRVTIETVVDGGTALAREAYEERSEPEFPSGIEYDSADQYAAAVTFNGALAAESMLEHDGEIVTPP